jgi:hypothetical protein
VRELQGRKGHLSRRCNSCPPNKVSIEKLDRISDQLFRTRTAGEEREVPLYICSSEPVSVLFRFIVIHFIVNDIPLQNTPPPQISCDIQETEHVLCREE